MAEMTKAEMLAYIAKLEAEKLALANAKASRASSLTQGKSKVVGGVEIPNDYMNLILAGGAIRISMPIEGFREAFAPEAAAKWLAEAEKLAASPSYPNVAQRATLRAFRKEEAKARYKKAS